MSGKTVKLQYQERSAASDIEDVVSDVETVVSDVGAGLMAGIKVYWVDVEDAVPGVKSA